MPLDIVLVVNGHRWQDAAEALLSRKVIAQPWSLAGLQDFVRIQVGSALGRALDQTALTEQRWCRSRALALDAQAVSAGFAIHACPHVGADDAGAGLSLEAAEAAAGVDDAAAVVMVGAAMPWMPLRRKIEARGQACFEYLLPDPGKAYAASERCVSLAQLAEAAGKDAPARALLRPMPESRAPAPSTDAPAIADAAAVAIRGKVCRLASGYGMVRRNDGLGEVQFLAAHVQAPGFDFIELGDELRFDVVLTPGGKWMARHVVRM